MKLTIIYDENEDMLDMSVKVNSDGLQKIMGIITDKKNIIVLDVFKESAQQSEPEWWSCSCGYAMPEPLQSCVKCGVPRR